MKKPKKFDCVQMKWDIQKKLAEEFAGVPEEEARKIQMERVLANPIIGRIFREAKVIELRI